MSKKKDDKLKKEVKKDIKKALSEIKKQEKLKSNESSTSCYKKIQKLSTYFEDECVDDIEIIEMTAEELVNWLIGSHNMFINNIELIYENNFFIKSNFESRYHICLYILKFTIYLEENGIPDILPDEIPELLLNRGEIELLNILSMLNYF